MFEPLVVIAGLVLSSGTGPFYWQGRVEAGQSIEIKNTYGSIHAEPALGDQAEVVAHRVGPKGERSEVKIGVRETATGVVIRAIEPEEGEPGGPIDFTVRVPDHVRFVGRTVNGSVEAEALTGAAVASTVNGDVRIRAAGETDAETVNGSITASVENAAGTHLRFSSVNGGITLQLPSSINARVSADTVYGGITSDFRVCLESRAAGRRARGVLGRGGPELTVVTVHGSIRLRRASGA